jgi:hypothetical protein
MPTEKTYIHGHYVKYDSSDSVVSYGVSYLRYDLDSEEARVFFDFAKRNGKAKFEDDNEYQFTLKYDPSDYYYEIEKRDY